MKNHHLLCLSFVLAALSGCADAPHRSVNREYPITLEKMSDGTLRAVPPVCPKWEDYTVNGDSTDVVTPLGCATARNLAIMIDNPKDLVEGRDPGPVDPTIAAAAIERYHNGQTKPLLDPHQTSSGSSSGSGGGQ